MAPRPVEVQFVLAFDLAQLVFGQTEFGDSALPGADVLVRAFIASRSKLDARETEKFKRVEAWRERLITEKVTC